VVRPREPGKILGGGYIGIGPLNIRDIQDEDEREEERKREGKGEKREGRKGRGESTASYEMGLFILFNVKPTNGVHKGM
jgi:hypothetical protein